MKVILPLAMLAALTTLAQADDKKPPEPKGIEAGSPCSVSSAA